MGYFCVAKFSRFCLKNMAIIFSRILIFTVGNVREKYFRFSLDGSTVRKENLWPKYLERNGILDYLQSDR